jgi:hypothetical protein
MSAKKVIVKKPKPKKKPKPNSTTRTKPLVRPTPDEGGKIVYRKKPTNITIPKKK